MKISYEVHQSHIPLWEDNDWRYAILMGGRGNGRSGTASRYVISQLLSKEYTRGAIMRAVHADIRASCWSEIIDRLKEAGIQDQFRITDNEMFIERGQNSLRAQGFKASSGSLTARLKSLANYNLVWIEEAEEIGEAEFRTLDDTLRTTKGRIKLILTLNTPAKSHWLIKRWFDLSPHPEAQSFHLPQLKSEAKDVLYLPGTWRENEPNLDPATVKRYQDYKLHNPNYYWQMIEGLAPEEVRGKIYSGWQLIDTVPTEARLLKFGVDWGWYPDPLAVIALYYYNGGYIVDEVIYGTNIDDEALATAIQSVPGWRATAAVCGADEPKSIEVLNKYGIRAEKAVAGPGSREFRIKTTAAKRIAVTKRSRNVWESYENYHWAEDRDGNPKGEPDHTFSDAMDSVSYAVASISPLKEYTTSHSSPLRQKTNIGL